MKTISIFIGIFICVLALQFCIEGLLSFSEQAKAEEELCRAREPGAHKLTRIDAHKKASAEHFSHVLVVQSKEHYCVNFTLIAPEDFSIVLAKLFNHSPPAMVS